MSALMVKNTGNLGEVYLLDNGDKIEFLPGQHDIEIFLQIRYGAKRIYYQSAYNIHLIFLAEAGHSYEIGYDAEFLGGKPWEGAPLKWEPWIKDASTGKIVSKKITGSYRYIPISIGGEAQPPLDSSEIIPHPLWP